MQYSYDKFDRTTKEQYNNVTYEYAYDASGQLAKQTSTAGEEYNYEYDSLGRLIRSNEYNDGTFEQRTEHIYDASNRLTKQSWYNAGGTTTMSYAYSTTTGLLSSLNATVQNSSLPVTYTYQGTNQLRSKAIGSVMTKAYNYCYNEDGGYRASLPNYVNYRDSSGNLIYGDNCYYDSNGRLVKILDSGSSTTTRATYGYDQQGQLTSATVGGTRYTYTYDTAGNIQSKKSWQHDDQLYLRQQRLARPADGVQRRLDHILGRQPDEVLRRQHVHVDAGTQTGDGQGRQHEYKLYLRYGGCSQQQDRGLDDV